MTSASLRWSFFAGYSEIGLPNLILARTACSILPVKPTTARSACPAMDRFPDASPKIRRETSEGWRTSMVGFSQPMSKPSIPCLRQQSVSNAWSRRCPRKPRNSTSPPRLGSSLIKGRCEQRSSHWPTKSRLFGPARQTEQSPHRPATTVREIRKSGARIPPFGVGSIS